MVEDINSMSWDEASATLNKMIDELTDSVHVGRSVVSNWRRD